MGMWYLCMDVGITMYIIMYEVYVYFLHMYMMCMHVSCMYMYEVIISSLVY